MWPYYLKDFGNFLHHTQTQWLLYNNIHCVYYNDFEIVIIKRTTGTSSTQLYDKTRYIFRK